MLLRKCFESIINLLDLSRDVIKQRVCRNCGYKFCDSRMICFCMNYDCRRRLKAMSQRRVQKLAKRYKENPKYCPICKNRQLFGDRRHAGDICPKCNNYQEY